MVRNVKGFSVVATLRLGDGLPLESQLLTIYALPGGGASVDENIFHAEGRCAAFAAWNNRTRHSLTTMVCASSSNTSANSSRISSGFARRPKQEQT